jgi:hypothetical protein
VAASATLHRLVLLVEREQRAEPTLRAHDLVRPPHKPGFHERRKLPEHVGLSGASRQVTRDPVGGFRFDLEEEPDVRDAVD